MPSQLLDVVPDAANAELAEVCEVLADLCRVQVELLGERLRRNGANAGRHRARSDTADTPTADSSSALRPILSFREWNVLPGACARLSQATDLSLARRQLPTHNSPERSTHPTLGVPLQTSHETPGRNADESRRNKGVLKLTHADGDCSRALGDSRHIGRSGTDAHRHDGRGAHPAQRSSITGKLVVIEHAILDEGALTRAAQTVKPIYIFWKDRPTTDRRGDPRRVLGPRTDRSRETARFAGYDFTRSLEAAHSRALARPGPGLRDARRHPCCRHRLHRRRRIRAIALAPERYEGREVKVIGRFKGRNLYGDLPQALGKGKWDFVLQSADGAVWVTGVRPRGKGFRSRSQRARRHRPLARGRQASSSQVGSLVYITATSLQAANGANRNGGGSRCCRNALRCPSRR